MLYLMISGDQLLKTCILPVSVLNQFMQSHVNKERQIIVITLLI